MIGLFTDLYNRVFFFLKDVDKINFLSASTKMHNVKDQFYYDEWVDQKNIVGLKYFNNFRYVCSRSEEIPNKIIGLKLCYDDNFVVSNIFFPPTLSTLIVDSKSNIPTFEIPNTVKCLTFVNHNPDIIPQNVKKLTLGYNYNKIILLPPNLKYLKFGDRFNRPIKICTDDKIDTYQYIPKSVTTLIFGAKFNQSIQNAIPVGITRLEFGNDFNQSITNAIPLSLKYLTFGREFNQPIEHCFPSSTTPTGKIIGIKHLTFGGQFNRPIKDCLPASITYLNLGYDFNQPITSDCIPKFIKQLIFSHHFNRSIFGCIPSSVTHLTFGGLFNQTIDKCIPNSVTHLTFGCLFNQTMIKCCIPNSVTHLTFGISFNKSIKDCIPNSVTHLTFGYCFNQDIYKCIPPSVTNLTLGVRFDQNLYNCFPNVTHLILPYGPYKTLRGKPQFGKPRLHAPWYKFIPSVTHLYLLKDNAIIECKY